MNANTTKNTQNQNPKISIIIPTLDSAKYVKECVDSVLALTQTPLTAH